MFDPTDVLGHVSVDYTATAARGAIVGGVTGGRHEVTLISNTDCYWKSGTVAVDATTSDQFLPGLTPMSFRLPAGHTHVSFIRLTVSGKASIITVG